MLVLIVSSCTEVRRLQSTAVVYRIIISYIYLQLLIVPVTCGVNGDVVQSSSSTSVPLLQSTVLYQCVQQYTAGCHWSSDTTRGKPREHAYYLQFTMQATRQCQVTSEEKRKTGGDFRYQGTPTRYMQYNTCSACTMQANTRSEAKIRRCIQHPATAVRSCGRNYQVKIYAGLSQFKLYCFCLLYCCSTFQWCLPWYIFSAAYSPGH